MYTPVDENDTRKDPSRKSEMMSFDRLCNNVMINVLIVEVLFNYCHDKKPIYMIIFSFSIFMFVR